MKRKISLFKSVFFVAMLLSCSSVFAQKDSLPVHKNKLSAFPVAYYSPETKLAVGTLAAYTFYNKNDSTQKYPSQIQFGAAYTFNKQLLFYIPFRIYTRRSSFTFYGEAGYYKYSYYFYGIGNKQPDDYKELYKVNYPRIKVNALKKVSKTFYAGLRYGLEDYNIIGVDSAQQLVKGKITGSHGGFVSGIGPAINFDTRDNIFSPSRGFFVDAGALFYTTALGSNFNFNRYTFDGSVYFACKNKNVWAFNLFADFVNGSTIPFSQLALLGGNKKMRGYYEGRYRDKNLLALAAEYRLHVYKRFGAVVFANAGAVNNETIKLTDYIRTTGGAGVRYALNKSEKLNIRLDYGIGKKTSGFYFTIGEAF
jgi:outer membrane translocation and assembly module TamA